MEYLEFNPLGQWILQKAKPAAVKPLGAPAKIDVPYKVHGGAGMTGELHDDHGAKGALHNFGGGKRPKPTWNKRLVNRPVSHPVHSVASERNPGLGNQEVE